MNQANETSQLSHFLWHNKIYLIFAMLVVIIAPSYLPNIGALICFFIVFATTLLAWNLNSFSSLGLKKNINWGKTILLGLLFGFALELSFQLLFNHLIELITNEPIDLSSLDGLRGNIGNTALMLLVGWVVGGFLEEVTFRGFMITKLREVFGDNSIKTVLYLLISAIPFGLAHMYQGWSGVISTGTIGLIIAIIYVRSKSNLWLVVFTHGFTNTFGITLIYTNWDQYFLNLWN